MEIYLCHSGELVDEVIAAAADIEVRRLGAARYLVRFEQGHSTAEVELWTTQKGRIRVEAWPDCPSWVKVATTDESSLESIDAAGVDVHVEQMDRGVYFFGFSRGSAHWGLSLVSDGYIKTRVRRTTLTPQTRNLSK